MLNTQKRTSFDWYLNATPAFSTVFCYFPPLHPQVYIVKRLSLWFLKVHFLLTAYIDYLNTDLNVPEDWEAFCIRNRIMFSKDVKSSIY